VDQDMVLVDDRSEYKLFWKLRNAYKQLLVKRAQRKVFCGIHKKDGTEVQNKVSKKVMREQRH